jgi:hypothetical protein
MVDQRIADAIAAAENDVDDALRQDVGEQLGHLQRRQRRLFGGLEDDRIAAGNRRRQLPGHHHQRVVPRRDRADDADGIAADHRGVARQIFAGDRPCIVAHGAGEEAVAIDDRRDFVIEHGIDRLAAVERFERAKPGGVLLDRVGDLQEISRSARRAWSATSLEGLFGGIDRSVDLGE